MKRQLLLYTFVFCLFTVMSQTNSYEESSPAQSFHKGFSRWSLMGEFGQNQNLPDGIGNIENMYGGALEYSFSPSFGLALNYFQMPITGITNNRITPFSTNLQELDLSFTLNLTKLVYPRTRQKFNISVNIGAGMALYEYDYSKGLVAPTRQISPNPNNAIIAPMRFILEYDFSKSFSIGARAHFIALMANDLEGVDWPHLGDKSNDYIVGGGVFIRYKIGATNKIHLRNANIPDFTPDESLEIATKVKKTTTVVKSTVDSLNERVAIYDNRVILLNSRVSEMDARISEMTNRTEHLEIMLSNDGADSDKDGVPDHRDIEPNTPLGVAVDFWGKALPIAKNEFAMNMDSLGREMSLRMSQFSEPTSKCCDSIVELLSNKLTLFTWQIDSLKNELANRESQAELNEITQKTNLNVDSILTILSNRLNQDNEKHIAQLTKVNVDSIVSVVSSQTNKENIVKMDVSSQSNLGQSDKYDLLLAQVESLKADLSTIEKQTTTSTKPITTTVTKVDNLSSPQPTGTPIEYIPQVFFGYDKADLDEAALITISKVAHKLESDPELKVEIRGFTDMAGNVKYNLQLSNRRAQNVRDELIRSWRIHPSRIKASGGGTTGKLKSTYGPNRRCDFFFSK